MADPAPAYPLVLVHNLVEKGFVRFTLSAVDGARRMGLDDNDILACVAALYPRDFYESMPARRRPGHSQDVYRTAYEGLRIYLKLQVIRDRLLVVISFKRR